MRTTADVAVLGLGRMGAALAGAFLAASRRVVVWNRTAARAEPLAARGAARASSVRDAVAAAPVTVLCVLDAGSVDEVLDEVGDAVRDRTVVNLTNVTPDAARRLGARVGDAGGRYLGGGVMAVPPTVATASATVLAGGPREVLDAHRDLLGIIGTVEYLGDDAGAAALHDVALLSAMYGMFGGFLHGVGLVRAASPGTAARYAGLAQRWVTAMTAALPRIAEEADSGEHGEPASTLGMQAAGFATLIDTARELGVPTDLIDPVRARLDRAVAAGHADDGLARLVDAAP